MQRPAVESSLETFLRFAFDLPSYRIEGPVRTKPADTAFNPSDSRRSLIEEAMSSAVSSRDQLRLLVRKLLVDRFGLVYHWDEREVKGYVLKVDATGPKLKPSQRSSKGSNVANCDGRIGMRDATIDELARRLASVVGQPVVNATGLDGKFDIDLRFRSDDPQAIAEGPSLVAALRGSLGLRLEACRCKIKYLVVDRIDHAPTRDIAYQAAGSRGL